MCGICGFLNLRGQPVDEAVGQHMMDLLWHRRPDGGCRSSKIRWMMNWPETIKRCFEADRVLYSSHARREMREEEFGPISDREVYEAACNAEILETYPDDVPYPSVLILGMTAVNRPLHAVCAYDADAD
ncbi:MAG TPA: DUF4258 domain-containing protein [Gammaproteobacteria bacterium]|jgi:hypothetical protein|nr:DUF4258 domain-containing protein [Gammaproteobacteria bacterium]